MSSALSPQLRAALAARGLEILPLKDIRWVETFSGNDGDFETWSFVFESLITELGWGDMWEETLARDGSLLLSSFSETARCVSENLYLILSQRVRGKAQVIVKMTEHGNGFEALKRLYKEYRPSAAVSKHNLLQAVIQPSWWQDAGHSRRPFMDVLLDWEDLMAQYERDTGERISSAIKCATVLGYAPPKVKSVLAGAPHRYREDFSLMKEMLRDNFLRTQDRSYVPMAPSGSDDPMDVGSIGWDKPKCHACGRLGHLAKDCWHKDGKKGKGDAGGKNNSNDKGGKGDKTRNSKGKGKVNPHASLVCRHCSKKGHIERDCWSKHGRPGGKGKVNDVQDTPEESKSAAVDSTEGHESHDEWIVLDGGSDEHCGRRDFATEYPLKRTSVRLRDAQNNDIGLDGEKSVNLQMGRSSGACVFKIGNFSRNLFSVAKMVDTGFIIHMEKNNEHVVTPDGLELKPKRKGNTYGVNIRVVPNGSCDMVETSCACAIESNVVAIGEDVDMNGDTEARGSGDPDPLATPAHTPEVTDQSRVDDEVVPVPLTIGAKVSEMKERLRELSQPVYGSKDQLWARLQKAERISREKVHVQRQIRRRQEERLVGRGGGEDVRPVGVPDLPPLFERRQHELTHTLAAPWCEACILGQGSEHPHTLVPFELRDGPPLVAFDYAFNTGGDEDGKAFGTSLVIVDAQTGYMHESMRE
eukprot:786750-Amphidinium_carterae.1